ncbi:hypothetical protein [Amycolatopsis sp. lyj-346]|uniref:hypothetical protein n=1 Tax=Amycolatopsis sp. lyj-346 TaxID=2789289 RepID=UPI003979288C
MSVLVGVAVVAGMTGSADGVADGVVASIVGVGAGVADRPGSQVPAVPSTVAVTTTTSNPVATATPVAENVMAIRAMTPVWWKVRMCMPFRAGFPASWRHPGDRVLRARIGFSELFDALVVSAAVKR